MLMADAVKKTAGSRMMNAFPAIAFVIVMVMAVIVYLEFF